MVGKGKLKQKIKKFGDLVLNDGLSKTIKKYFWGKIWALSGWKKIFCLLIFIFIILIPIGFWFYNFYSKDKHPSEKIILINQDKHSNNSPPSLCESSINSLTNLEGLDDFNIEGRKLTLKNNEIGFADIRCPDLIPKEFRAIAKLIPENDKIINFRITVYSENNDIIFRLTIGDGDNKTISLQDGGGNSIALIGSDGKKFLEKITLNNAIRTSKPLEVYLTQEVINKDNVEIRFNLNYSPAENKESDPVPDSFHATYKNPSYLTTLKYKIGIGLYKNTKNPNQLTSFEVISLQVKDITMP